MAKRMKKPAIGKARDRDPEMQAWPIKLFIKGSVNIDELKSFSNSRPGTLLLPVQDDVLHRYEALSGDDRSAALSMIVREMDYAYGCPATPPFEFRILKLGVNFMIPPVGVTFVEVP